MSTVRSSRSTSVSTSSAVGTDSAKVSPGTTDEVSLSLGLTTTGARCWRCWSRRSWLTPALWWRTKRTYLQESPNRQAHWRSNLDERGSPVRIVSAPGHTGCLYVILTTMPGGEEKTANL